MKFINFFREDTPESMTRLMLFLIGTTICLIATFLILFFILAVFSNKLTIPDLCTYITAITPLLIGLFVTGGVTKGFNKLGEKKTT